MGPKDANGMANSVDPDQTADLGLYCLPLSENRIIVYMMVALKSDDGN